MAPGNNERHPGHTGTIPKTKVRNNCNVPQEAVTPTRRDMTTNLVSTALDWVPVSEYNTRTNYSQTRKQTNNSSDQELTDLDNSVSYDRGFGRFVPVRPQPRVLPLNVQNSESLSGEPQDDVAGSSLSGHNLHPYSHQMQNGLIPHTNHAAAAVMIVNPTTPNTVTGNVTQPFNAPNQNRNNLTRNLNSARNNFESASNPNNNNTTTPITNSRTVTKTVNLMNNMYDQAQGSYNNLNEPSQVHRESARALGEAIVAACPDAAAVERRLGQIREYIRVTSTLVDTMRNSDDEAFIDHTKEEYDDLVEMVMKLKDSEKNLESFLSERRAESNEILTEEINGSTDFTQASNAAHENSNEISTDGHFTLDKNCNIKNTTTDNSVINNNLKKVTNLENEQLNKSMHSVKIEEVQEVNTLAFSPEESDQNTLSDTVQIVEIDKECFAPEESKVDDYTSELKNDEEKDLLQKNIMSCVQKVAIIEEMKQKNNDSQLDDQQDNVTRPVSVQSNGSTYSDNELWQNEIKSKMELSQMRLTALKQQQKRLLKYQEEAKQQLEEMNRERQIQDVQPSTSHDNFAIMQNQSFSGNYHNSNRMYAANQIGVATTLPQSSEVLHGQQNMTGNVDNDNGHLSQGQGERFSHRDANIAGSEGGAVGGVQSEEEDEILLNERGRILEMKLKDLKMKKQHMENMVTQFQKLQMDTRMPTTHNTYSSSGEDSGGDEPSRKCVKSSGNIKNEDPFKLMEIKAIKTALQKTKDLMRSVENYETEHISSGHEYLLPQPTPYRDMSTHSNIHDNKSEGGGSMGGWSNESSVCRVRNTLPQRHKFTNEQQHHPQQAHVQQQQQHHPQQAHVQQQQHHPQQAHVQQQQQQLLQEQQQHQQLIQESDNAHLASFQETAQELCMEIETVMGERARIKEIISNKELSRKQKKVNEEVKAGPSGIPGPVERRQIQLRALLAEKQRELEALLNKEKVLCAAPETQKTPQESACAGSIINQSYIIDQEERGEQSTTQIIMDPHSSPREPENFVSDSDAVIRRRPVPGIPSHLASTYGSDTDSASRNKSNQRNRPRRRQQPERQTDDSNMAQANNTNQYVRNEPRVESANVNTVPPTSQNGDNTMGGPYPHPMPPYWNTSKSNQDMRTNQFTQNSHSQTMDRLLGTPQMSFPPSMPFNMMMPFSMVSGCGCGCGFWGSWCWQQLVLQQRELHQLREQVNHLEERWRVETASHTLNNQVPPGNRANNYWDNFRSYSRQNLLSANNKANADGHLGAGLPHNPHPLVERSHNTLHHTSSVASPCVTPKRNTNTASSSQNAIHQPQPNNEEILNRHPRRNVIYERSLSFSSAPDVLNVNQNTDSESLSAMHSRNIDDVTNLSNVNINRQESSSNSFINLSITNPIPEIIQAHSNNLNSVSSNSKRKSSSKLPAKNSTNRRNCALDYAQTSNINIASTSEVPNPNLASTSRELHDKATSKLFDLLRENIYSEVTTLIGVNESHPDFLIQLFRELQLISSDHLRQKVLQSIRNVLSQYSSLVENEIHTQELHSEVITSTAPEQSNYNDYSSLPMQNACSSTIHVNSKVVPFLLLKCEETCNSEFLEALASHILSSASEGRHSYQLKKRLLEILSKYEGMRVCDVSSDIIENLPLYLETNAEADSAQHGSNMSQSVILQDVAGSLNLFNTNNSQLHQLNACPYDMWSGHIHMDIESSDLNNDSPRCSQEGKVDLIDCSEIHNGDLAEADQTCHTEMDDIDGNNHDDSNAEVLPDVVDTEEVTPTEAEAEWLGLDRVPTRLHMEESSEKQKD